MPHYICVKACDLCSKIPSRRLKTSVSAAPAPTAQAYPVFGRMAKEVIRGIEITTSFSASARPNSGAGLPEKRLTVKPFALQKSPLPEADQIVLHARAHNALATALALVRADDFTPEHARQAIKAVRRALPALGQIGGAA